MCSQMRYALAIPLVLAVVACGHSTARDIALCRSEAATPDSEVGRSAIERCMETKGYKFHMKNGCVADSATCYAAPGRPPANYPFPPN